MPEVLDGEEDYEGAEIIRAAARRCREIIYRHAGIQPGKDLTVDERLILLQSAADPGCPRYQDADYYVRVAATKLAVLEYQAHRLGHHEDEKRHTCPQCEAEMAAKRRASPLP